jgi:hypothetical protein
MTMPKSMTAPQDRIQDDSHEFKDIEFPKEAKDELVLCEHCLRTATNGIKCQGICVSDSSY